MLRPSENSQSAALQAGAHSGASTRLFIDGAWRAAASTHTFADINPTTRQPYATVADGDVGDMASAITAAKAAQPAWEALPPAARSEFFYRAAEIFQANQEKFVNVLVEETGSGLGKAMFECSLIPLALREAAALTTRPTGKSCRPMYRARLTRSGGPPRVLSV
ncbi:aldehyde dehydrogenase family protein (plasmid) [Rhizobium sp. RCAM05350]|nr:aldehyde dehydrogenase family protein [Rhizobium sp. RCAM05350]